MQNCSQTAADGHMVTIDRIHVVAIALSHGTITESLRLTVHPQYHMIG